jgi:hypothetical protein
MITSYALVSGASWILARDLPVICIPPPQRLPGLGCRPSGPAAGAGLVGPMQVVGPTAAARCAQPAKPAGNARPGIAAAVVVHPGRPRGDAGNAQAALTVRIDLRRRASCFLEYQPGLS